MTTKEVYESIRVLVLEDEGHIRQIICSLLRQLGFRHIHEASDGGEGFKELVRVRPEVVLCDIHMKPVDGRQFLKMVRTVKVEWVKNIPIIFLTADANPDTVAFAKEFQINGYLVKPVSVNDLKARIDSVLKTLDRSAHAQGL